jgi:soluble lytic murein transglycosylase-like protein
MTDVPSARVPLLALVLLAGTAVPSRAELVWLTTGRTMSVKSHRVDGDKVTLVLRQGGEVTCPAELVARVDADEVPYPDLVTAASPSPATLVARIPLTGPFADLIRDAAVRNRLDPDLVHAVIRAESNYAPKARSSRGARGLMQLMPDTLREYRVRNAFDPTANIEAGSRHLRTLLDRYPLETALAAYNAGEGAVIRYGGIPPYPETRSYVSRVLTTLGLAAPALR